MDDLDRLVREFAPVVREFVADAVGEMSARVKALEDGSVVKDLRAEVVTLKGELDTLRDAVSTRPEPDVAPLVKACVAEAVAAIPLPKDGINGADGVDGKNGLDGKDGQAVSIEDVTPIISAEIQRAVADIPLPKDGTSVDVDDVKFMVLSEVHEAVAALPPAKDGAPGKSVEIEEVCELVRKAVDEIPKPQDGKSVTVEDIEPLISSEVAKAVNAIPPAKDGIGVVSALIDRDGHLIVTLSDGATKDVGTVVGQDADPDEVERLIVAEVAKIPKPKDGVDGFGFDDLSVEKTGKRTVTFSFVKGDRVQSWPIVFEGMQFWEGPFVEGKSYEAGDQVQFGGHQWTAKEDTDGTVKPDEHTADGKRVWVMSVRRGREGKVGPQGLPGPKGKDGIDWGRK